MFDYSVRDMYHGAKAVTQWFKYHEMAHGWLEGIDYVERVVRGRVDWLLSPAAAVTCGLIRHSAVKHKEGIASGVSVGIKQFVYVVKYKDTYRIGFTLEPTNIIGDWVDLITCHNADALCRSVAAYFQPHALRGGVFSSTLPVDDVWRYMRANAAR